jgi:hypothetical protein
MSETPLPRVPDGHPLLVLPGGLTIVRYIKHEWNPNLEKLSASALAGRTDKIYGSKFLPVWGLERLVAWMADQIYREGWIIQPGARYKLDVRLDEYVGLAKGVKVHTIRIVSDGRYAHAYPIQDV